MTQRKHDKTTCLHIHVIPRTRLDTERKQKNYLQYMDIKATILYDLRYKNKKHTHKCKAHTHTHASMHTHNVLACLDDLLLPDWFQY